MRIHDSALAQGWQASQTHPDDYTYSPWGELQTLADQLYALVNKGVVNFERVVSLLASQCYDDESNGQGSPPKLDTGFLWALNQCLPLDSLKPVLANDVSQGQGRLLHTLLALEDPLQAQLGSGFSLRDSSVEVLVFRVKNAQAGDPVIQARLPVRSDHFFDGVRFGLLLLF